MEVVELFKKLEIGHNLIKQGQNDTAFVIFAEILAEPNCPKNLKITVERAVDQLQQKEIVESNKTVQQELQQGGGKSSLLKGNILQVDVFTLDSIPQLEDKMPISDIDYNRLKEGIKKRGIQVPLVALPTFKLVCGYNRLKIAKELGLKTVPVEFKDIPYQQLFEYAMKDNIERRHLTQEQVIAYIEEVTTQGTGRPKKGSRTKTNEEIAETLGVSERTVQRAKIKAKKYNKMLAESPDLKGKSIKDVLEGEKPIDRFVTKFDCTMGVDDIEEEMSNSTAKIIDTIFKLNPNNGDKIKIVTQIYLKRRK